MPTKTFIVSRSSLFYFSEKFSKKSCFLEIVPEFYIDLEDGGKSINQGPRTISIAL